MKKLSFIVMAGLMVLGLTQCKKNEPSNNSNADNGDRVSITLKLENGGQRVHPEEENGLANVVYDNGDVVYVGSDGKYMGYLTYNGTLFTGSINAAAIEGHPLQFVFLGGQDFHNSLTESSSTECTFNIGDQSNGLAVISCAASNENFSATKLDYTATLRNKCALVKFDLGEVSTDAAITLTGLKNTATIGFDGTVTNGTATGNIVTYGTGSSRYAVMLSDQTAVTTGTLSASGYTGTFSIPTAAYTNAFLTDASITLIAQWVDLGLPSGLLWATCNVGADNPEEYGDYFAWGETTTKSTYDWSTYQYCNGGDGYNTLTKYCNKSEYGYNGFTDNLTTLEPSDDAATANWGANWRMPTQAEFQELISNTNVTWETVNGISGNRYTNKNDSSKSIFLPAAGYRDESGLGDAGSIGCYWSSSLITDEPFNAWFCYFESDYYEMTASNRYYGFTVRPVRSAE